MPLNITILGCGSSGGVPRVGQGWGACDPANPKNRRRRCSILVEHVNDTGLTTRVLIDMSPDLRQQLLDAEVDHLDAILLTHPHADHINGIDDIRPLVLKTKSRIALHMNAETASVVRGSFSYIFETPPGSQYPPLLDDIRIESGDIVQISGAGGAIDLRPFALCHGEIGALGFRVGAVAYTPDVSAIPETSRAFLEDLDIWVVDALRYRPHPSHLSLSEALEWIVRMKPQRAILTNLHTDMDFETLRRTLPPNVEPAHDGMRLSAK